MLNRRTEAEPHQANHWLPLTGPADLLSLRKLLETRSTVSELSVCEDLTYTLTSLDFV